MLQWGSPTSGIMADPRKSTLGFAASTANPLSVNYDAPTFPPTALMFQTYAFIPIGAHEPSVGLEEGQRNMLLYLNMTRHKPFPIEKYLNYSGNHVPSTIDGSVCIERDVFWNSFLLREAWPLLLHALNKATRTWLGDIWIDYKNSKVDYGATFGVGPWPGLNEPIEYFRWVPVDTTSWVYNKSYNRKATENVPQGGGTFEMWCK